MWLRSEATVPHRSKDVLVGRGVADPALLLALIHRSAWKVNSANFALKAFYEVPSSKPHPSFACIASVERAGVSYS
jgi:hypothetical protein